MRTRFVAQCSYGMNSVGATHSGSGIPREIFLRFCDVPGLSESKMYVASTRDYSLLVVHRGLVNYRLDSDRIFHEHNWMFISAATNPSVLSL